jgi:hypothetical protein
MRGDVVATRGEKPQRIAGPQAQLAPHGRGDGWGRIGERGLRRRLSVALDTPAASAAAADIRAGVDALARGARDVVLAVPDLPDFDEARQGRLIRIIRDGRGPQVRLLWRSVAAFLDLLDRGLIPRDDTDTAWDILIHGASGIERQRLTLVADRDHAGHVAPRRDGPGTLILPDLGLDTLLQRAKGAASSGIAAKKPGWAPVFFPARQQRVRSRFCGRGTRTGPPSRHLMSGRATFGPMS